MNFELNQTYKVESSPVVEREEIDEVDLNNGEEPVSLTIETAPVEPILPKVEEEGKLENDEPAFEVEAADDEDKNYTPLES